MSLYIEYYEVKTANGYEYYFMPMNPDAKNKENMDNRSHRIWKFNTRNNRFTEILNRRKGKPQANRAELLKIQLLAKPVPWNENYLFLQRVREERERHKAEGTAILD